MRGHPFEPGFDLTLRRERLVGVSVENSASLARIAHLRQAPAAVRFLSVEPSLGPIGQWGRLGGAADRSEVAMQPNDSAGYLAARSWVA